MKVRAIKVLCDSAIVQLAGSVGVTPLKYGRMRNLRPSGNGEFIRNRRPRRCKSRRQKPAVPAVRHPATDGTHVVMDSRVMSPVQLRRRRKVNETYRLPRICVAHGVVRHQRPSVYGTPSSAARRGGWLWWRWGGIRGFLDPRHEAA